MSDAGCGAAGSAQAGGEGQTLAELTWLSLGLGVVVGLIMSVANVYLGLFAGMTVSASIPAAVVSMGLLKGLLKRGTILENNVVQTIASAGESLAAGIIFTMPALVIAGVWTEFDFWTTTLVSMTGGLLGVLFMIPLRRPMIVENADLIYPEGVACAKVLQAGDRGGSGMRYVFGALGLGMFIKLLTDAVELLSGGLQKMLSLGSSRLFLGFIPSPALIAVGYIVGFNIATLVFIGGAISWLAAGPLLTAMAHYGTPAVTEGFDGPLFDLVKSDVKFLGVGAMIIGGLFSILQIRHGIRQGLQQTFGSYRDSLEAGQRPRRTDTDLSRPWVLFLLAATALIVLVLYQRATGSVGVSLLATVLMTVCAFFFVAVAAYIVGLVGSSNSPVSGMTICSVLLTSGFIALFGFSGETAILATMGVAGVVCCATCTSGDVCQDLKTGYLVGATPYRQQWGEVLGVVTASFVMAPILGVLHSGYGIGTDQHLSAELQGSALEAPQATLFASLMRGFFGDEILPWKLIIAGVWIGLAIILVDQMILRPKNSRFRMHVMPVAVGMYLPFGLSTAILLGGLLAWWSARSARRASPEAAAGGHERGVLLASGLIAGEAMAGVAIAVPKAMEVELPEWTNAFTDVLTVFAVAVVAFLLLRVSKARATGS